jgi:hypothetical protein
MVRQVLPGGAILGREGERPVACRPGAAVLEQTRPRLPANLPPTSAGQTTADKSASHLSPAKLPEQSEQTPRVAPTSRLNEHIEKVIVPVIIAVLTAIILAWLGLNK